MTIPAGNNEMPPPYAPSSYAPASYASATTTIESTSLITKLAHAEIDVTYIPDDRVHVVEAIPVMDPTPTNTGNYYAPAGRPTSNSANPPGNPVMHPTLTNTGNYAPAGRPTSNSANPPGNCPDGGQWGIVRYVGGNTGLLACLGCLICGIFGLFIVACPQDQKDAYRYQGKIYDAAGVFIGNARKLNFEPTRQKR